jgi:tetratricopeptide (TPR) repeat protein
LAIDAVDGMPGVGKTALAIHTAHRLIGRYPDAQLFVDLRGYTAGQSPLKPKAALAALLRAMGVPAERIPQTLALRRDEWRITMADKRALIVLDNAKSTAQVTPLLPGSSSCRVIVTSRERLSGLEGARPLSVDELSTESAIALLANVIGPERVDAEREAAEEVVSLCGHLPLAIQLAGNRLRHHATWSLSSIAEDLVDSRRKWQTLHAEDVGVYASFTLSYEDLSTAAQVLLKSVALCPGPHFSTEAATALYGGDSYEVFRLLDELYTHHLVQEPRRGQYHFHDLIRDYLLALVTKESDAWRDERLVALCQLYGQAALFSERESESGVSIKQGIGFESQEGLVNWLELERPNVSATVHLAQDKGWDEYVRDIPLHIASFLLSRGYTTEALDLHELSVRACVRLGDAASEALARENLATAAWDAGDFRRALQEYDLALAFSRQQKDEETQARLLERIGFTYERTGAYGKARDALRAALSIRVQLDDERGEAGVHNAMGAVNWREKLYEAALEEFQLAVTIYESGGIADSGGATLNNIGLTYQRMGQYAEAMTYLRKAEAIGVRQNDPRGLSVIYNNFGFTQVSMGDYEEARRNAEKGLSLARQVGSAYQEARAHNSLGLALVGLEDVNGGLMHLREAMRLYQVLEVPEAVDVAEEIQQATQAGAKHVQI